MNGILLLGVVREERDVYLSEDGKVLLYIKDVQIEVPYNFIPVRTLAGAYPWRPYSLVLETRQFEVYTQTNARYFLFDEDYHVELTEKGLVSLLPREWRISYCCNDRLLTTLLDNNDNEIQIYTIPV